MSRTTLDIDSTVLRALKRIARESGRTIGEVASELLARALRSGAEPDERFTWRTRQMKARVDLEDKDTIYRMLDER